MLRAAKQLFEEGMAQDARCYNACGRTLACAGIPGCELHTDE